MDRKQTRISAFQVFANKTTSNGDSDDIKSGKHKQIKDRATDRRSRKSKFDDLSDLSFTSKIKTRSSTKITDPEFVKNICKKLIKAKQDNKMRKVSDKTNTDLDSAVHNLPDTVRNREKKNISFDEKYLAGKSPKYGKNKIKNSSDNIITNDNSKITSKKMGQHKAMKKTSNDFAIEDMQTDSSEIMKQVKRKHGDESVEQFVAIRETRARKSKNKKRKSASTMMTKPSNPDFTQVVAKEMTSQKSRLSSEMLNGEHDVSIDDDEPQIAVYDNTVQIIPEIIDVNLIQLSSAVTSKENAKNNSRKEGKKLMKSKSTSDINPHVTKKYSNNSVLNMSWSSSKWKIYPKTPDETGIKESSPSSPKSFEVDEDPAKQQNESSLKAACTFKPDKSKPKKSKSKKVKKALFDKKKQKNSKSKKENDEVFDADRRVSNSRKRSDAVSDDSVCKKDDGTVSIWSSSGDNLKNTTVDEMETLSAGAIDSPNEKGSVTVALNTSYVSVEKEATNTDDHNISVDKVDTANDEVHKSYRKPRILALEAIDTAVLLVLPHPHKICLQGRALIKVICGSATILQYNLTQNSPACRVFSPSSNSLLTLETSSGVGLSVLKSDVQYLSEDYALLDEIDPNSDDLFMLLRIDAIHSASLDYLCAFLPFTNLFSLSIGASRAYNQVLQTVGLAVAFPDKVDLSVMSVTDGYVRAVEKWVDLVKYSDTPPVVLVCAGKNCGKSTTARMLVNAALNVTDEVCFLDCDVGQSELMPSGSICLHRLTEPLLGPPFTHQREPHSMGFFGGVTASDNPNLYVSQLQYVYGYYRNMKRPAPLVINTMGWVEGLGVCLLMDTIHLTSPNLIIQLDSESRLNSFNAITPEYVINEPGWFFSKTPISEVSRPTHELIQLKSLSDNLQSVILSWKPMDHRNMSLLAYLSAPVKPRRSLHSLTPYVVPWSKVAVHVCHYAVTLSQVFCAMNANVVALCHADLSQAHRPNEDSPWFFDKVPICQCLGLGLVRGIDMDQKEIYVITPLSGERLQQVNTILKGSNAIPESILIQQKCVDFIPYVDTILMTQTAGKYRTRRIARR